MTNRWRWFYASLFTCLVLSIVVCDPDAQTKKARTELDRRIQGYPEPPPLSAENESALAAVIYPDPQISGEWMLRQHMAGCTMTVRQAVDSPSEFLVQIAVSRCQGVWNRKGTLSNGVLELDEAVAVQHRAAFRKLVAIETDGIVRLAPMPDLPEILGIVGSDDEAFWLRLLTFEKQGEATCREGGDVRRANHDTAG